jgi:phosphatidylglycerophosphatase A
MTANKIVLWIAQGLGTGRAPVAPGTFGSALGFFWFLLIVAPGNFAFFATAILLSFFVSVLCSEIGEQVLRQRDPGCIVIDEIIAIPICFLGWMAVDPTVTGPMWFLTGGHWKISVAILLGFRVFDIAKPWPVRQSQKLPGGWGVTVDDVLAAIYVAVISGVLLARR